MTSIDRRSFVFAASAGLLLPKQALAQVPAPPPGVLAEIAAAPTIPDLQVSGVHKMTGRVLKANRCVVAPGGALEVQDIDLDWIALCFDELNFEGGGAIRRVDRKAQLNGANGDAGENGKHGRSAGEAGSAGESGRSGRDGRTQAVPEIYVFVRNLLYRGVPALPSNASAHMSFDFNGHDGGDGGSGGRGGNGGNGAKGEKARDGGWFGGCASGPGWGGAGGNAGSGGSPGMPANGGDARPIYFFAPVSRLNVLKSAKISLKGGRPGKLGQVGPYGAPGKGGPVGDPDGKCGSDPVRNGPNGRLPPKCATWDIGARSGKAAVPEFLVFTNFADLKIG